MTWQNEHMYCLEAGADRAEVLALITRQQLDPATATTYLDAALPVEAELERLSPPWQSTLRVVRNRHGVLVGAVVIEINPLIKRAWIHGPWTTPHVWHDLAKTLVEAALAQCPADITDWELGADLANERMRWLAEQLGWPAGRINFNYSTPMAVARSGPADPDYVRLACPEDLPAIAAMHKEFFPHTYLGADEMLSGRQRTLVAISDGGEVMGYITGRETDKRNSRFNFLGVREDFRRQHVGSALMRALARTLEGEYVALSSTDAHELSWRLLRSLGYDLNSAFRGYRHRGETDDQARPSSAEFATTAPWRGAGSSQH